MRRAKLWVGVVTVLTLGAEQALHAEGPIGEAEAEATDPASASAAASPPAGVEEIIVSARKREESLQDVPVAVTAVRGEDLDRYHANDLTKATQMIPQVIATEAATGNGGTIQIRGIGSSSTNVGFEQAVSIYVDGLQHSRANVLAQGYFDLGQLEVLKGPQALFFGKNSSAGVLSLRSADPGDSLELIGRTGYEFGAGEYWGEAIGSTPIGERLGIRLALRYSELGGYVENLAPATTDVGSLTPIPPPAEIDWPDKNEFLGRLTVAYRPTDDLDLKLKLAGANLEMSGVSQAQEMFLCEAFGRSTFDLGENCKPDYEIRQNDLPAAVAATEGYWNRDRGAMYRTYSSWSLALTGDYDLGLAKLTSVTGYTNFDTRSLGDFDFSAAPLIWSSEDIAHNALSQEVRLLTDLDFPVNAMLGAYYQKSHLLYHNLPRVVPFPQDPTTGRYASWQYDSPSDGHSISGFGQLIWDVTETIELSPGARYTHETKDSHLVYNYVHPGWMGLIRPEGVPIGDEFRDSDLSPEIPIAWRPTLWDWADLTLYAAYKQGFKAGGFANTAIAKTDSDIDDLTFESEKVKGWEGGVKSQWLDGRLILNAIGYSYDFEDLQVNFFDSANIAFITVNAASAATHGMETELRWLPPLVEGLDLHGALAYNVARYDDFLAYCYAGQTIQQGCNLDENGAPAPVGASRQDLGGTIRPLAPKWTANMGFRYERPLFDVFDQPLRLGLSIDSNYTDHYLLSDLGRRVFQGSFFRTDASVSLFRDDGLFELAFFGRNLSDEYTLTVIVDAPLSGAGTGTPVGSPADEVGVVGRPRELGLQLTARF